MHILTKKIYNILIGASLCEASNALMWRQNRLDFIKILSSFRIFESQCLKTLSEKDI